MLQGTKYLKTEIDALKLGDSEAEVCFLGRSNVGKSTLINTLCNKTKLARISSVPGKTRTINVYEVSPGRWIVDLPGYGYAIGPKDEKEKLGPMIEGYLNSRDNLRMIFVIIDAVAGPTKLDLIMVEWLKHYALPFSILVNKTDKIRPSKLDARKAEISFELALDPRDISWISSDKKIGIKDLQKKIAKLLAA